MDSLGPSRVSGFADLILEWEDLVSIFRIGEAALDSTDTDDRTRLIRNIATDGITIAVGAEAPSTSDYQPDDPDINTPPEMAEAGLVYCSK